MTITTCTANATHPLAQPVSKTKSTSSTLVYHSTSPQRHLCMTFSQVQGPLGTTLNLPRAHNERHQSPTCPLGHPVTNPLLKPYSRFQVTFVTNSSSISIESELNRDTLTRGGTTHYPCSHVYDCSENPIQLTICNWD